MTSSNLGRTASRLIARVFLAEGRPFKPEQLLRANAVSDAVVVVLGLPATAEVADICLGAAIPSY